MNSRRNSPHATNNRRSIERLATLLHSGARVVFVTGAGISRASGIATFRGDDENAVWNRSLTEVRVSASDGTKEEDNGQQQLILTLALSAWL